MPWLKWYPDLAQASLKWRRLTLAERGLFHELYDFAAMANPRGRLSVPHKELARALYVDSDTFGALLAPLLREGLIVQKGQQTLVFPDFSRHQRNAPLRPRRDSGATVAQPWRTEKEEEEDVEEEVEKETPLPPLLNVPQFRSAWADWLEYRKQARYKKYTPLGLKRLLNKLERWTKEYDLAAVVGCINLSIENGWQGLFEPKPSGGKTASKDRGNKHYEGGF